MKNEEKVKIPSLEKIANEIYEYCKTQDITYIREDELSILFLKDKENFLLEQIQKDEDNNNSLSNENIVNVGNFLIFQYKTLSRLYDIMDILIDAYKADREIEDEDNDEEFYYYRFYITERDIENIKCLRSNIEILSKHLYSYCKENNIEHLNKDEIKKIFQMDENNYDNEDILKKITDYLVDNNMAKETIINDEIYIILFLSDEQIQLVKNAKTLLKNEAESLLDFIYQNEITHIEKEKLRESYGYDKNNDIVFNELLEYLKKHRLIFIKYDEQTKKEYIDLYRYNND